jgi:two-component system, cell cycle response regulator
MSRTPRTPEELAAVLDELELLTFRDYPAAKAPAEEAERVARELSDDSLRMRALLVQADVFGREGQGVASGRVAREVNRWAREHLPEQAYLLARSHRVLASFFERLEDATSFLQHAMEAVELLPDDVSPRVRLDHLMALAIAQARIPTLVESAFAGFVAAERLAAAIAPPDVHLMIVNNQAYTRFKAGDLDNAQRAVERLHELSSKYAEPLDPVILDTVARVAAARGDYEAAEHILLPLLEPDAESRSRDRIAVPECLLTLAEVERLKGDTTLAERALVRCRELASARGLKSVLMRATKEQALIYAAAERWREAFFEEVRYVEDFATISAAAVTARAEVLQAFFDTEQAQRASEQFQQLALHDPLTGLFNRRYVDDQLTTILAHLSQTGEPISMAFVDLDHFKRINDTCSHAVGDEVLRNTARMLRDAAPEAAFAARMGGEEFLLVMPGTGAADALDICRAVQTAIRSFGWTAVTGDVPVRASIGLTTQKGAGLSQVALLGVADGHLYEAKEGGRDRIVTADAVVTD